VHDEGSDVFKTALTFIRYLLFIGRETKKGLFSLSELLLFMVANIVLSIEDQSRRRNHLRLALVILGLFLLIAEVSASIEALDNCIIITNSLLFCFAVGDFIH